MDRLIDAVRNYRPSSQPENGPDELARALERRDWQAYYRALEQAQATGHRRICTECLTRADSISTINRRLIVFHARIHAAGVAAIFVLFFGAPGRPVSGLLRRAIESA
jgi:hypothetical protein